MNNVFQPSDWPGNSSRLIGRDIPTYLHRKRSINRHHGFSSDALLDGRGDLVHADPGARAEYIEVYGSLLRGLQRHLA